MPQIDVLKLASYFEKSRLSKFSYSIDNETLVLEKQISQNAAPATAPCTTVELPVVEEATTDDNVCLVKSPLVGIFYAAKSPEDAPFISVGDTVKKGQLLCLVEAMKMMNEITAPTDGVIKSVHCSNEQIVAYNDVLFEIVS